MDYWKRRNRARSWPGCFHCLRGVGYGSEAAVGGELLEAVGPVAEPDPQMNIVVILKDGFIDRSHAIDRIIPEHDGYTPLLTKAEA